MKYIKVLTGMTDKWFYALIKQGLFPHPIKLGRSSRWRLVDVENWIVMQIQNKSQR
ncbi:helix-turn-helix transcriptional regulator [Orbus mooreae]|uniref:helix-turn-helix transcriptional regulator n=1 Tax=Orbus mooreae TaxID=3074107 RepID=UPI00370D9E26